MQPNEELGRLRPGQKPLELLHAIPQPPGRHLRPTQPGPLRLHQEVTPPEDTGGLPALEHSQEEPPLPALHSAGPSRLCGDFGLLGD
jgi:hypothetical protein